MTAPAELFKPIGHRGCQRTCSAEGRALRRCRAQFRAPVITAASGGASAAFAFRLSTAQGVRLGCQHIAGESATVYY